MRPTAGMRFSYFVLPGDTCNLRFARTRTVIARPPSPPLEVSRSQAPATTIFERRSATVFGRL